MAVTLKNKCEAKVNLDLAKTEFDLLMMRVPSSFIVVPSCLEKNQKNV